jgi:hypothetical protein
VAEPDERDVMTLAIDQQVIVDGVTGQESVEEFTAVTEVTAFEQRGDQWYLEGNVLFSAFLRPRGQPDAVSGSADDAREESGETRLSQVQHRMPFDLTVPVLERGAGPVGVAVVVPEAVLTIVDSGVIGITGVLVIEGLATRAGYIAHFGAQEEVRGPRTERAAAGAGGSSVWRPATSRGAGGDDSLDTPGSPFVARGQDLQDQPPSTAQAPAAETSYQPVWPYKSGQAPQPESEPDSSWSPLLSEEQSDDTTFVVEAMRSQDVQQAPECDELDPPTARPLASDGATDAQGAEPTSQGWPVSGFAHLHAAWDAGTESDAPSPPGAQVESAAPAAAEGTPEALTMRGEPVAPATPAREEPAAIGPTQAPQASYVPVAEPPVEMTAGQWFWSTLGIPDNDETYTLTFRIVQAADTVEEIAAHYGTTVAELVSVNRLEQSEVMAGSVIRIPR